jgi:hypothetical protein
MNMYLHLSIIHLSHGLVSAGVGDIIPVRLHHFSHHSSLSSSVRSWNDSLVARYSSQVGARLGLGSLLVVNSLYGRVLSKADVGPSGQIFSSSSGSPRKTLASLSVFRISSRSCAVIGRSLGLGSVLDVYCVDWRVLLDMSQGITRN